MQSVGVLVLAVLQMEHRMGTTHELLVPPMRCSWVRNVAFVPHFCKGHHSIASRIRIPPLSLPSMKLYSYMMGTNSTDDLRYPPSLGDWLLVNS